MITQSLAQTGMALAAWVGGLFPAAPSGVAGTLTDTRSMWADLMRSFVGLGAWVDWAWLLAVVGLVGGVYLVMFGAKLVRAVGSYLPFIGGAG